MSVKFQVFSIPKSTGVFLTANKGGRILCKLLKGLRLPDCKRKIVALFFPCSGSRCRKSCPFNRWFGAGCSPGRPGQPQNKARVPSSTLQAPPHPAPRLGKWFKRAKDIMSYLHCSSPALNTHTVLTSHLRFFSNRFELRLY